MQTYTISEVARDFQMQSSTLRYYEEVGLLTNVGRTPSKQRIYSECHINRLNSICCFKNTGMSIAQLQKFYSLEENELENLDEIRDMLKEHKVTMEEQIEQLQKAYEHLEKKTKYFDAIKKSREENTELPTWDDFC